VRIYIVGGMEVYSAVGPGGVFFLGKPGCEWVLRYLIVILYCTCRSLPRTTSPKVKRFFEKGEEENKMESAVFDLLTECSHVGTVLGKVPVQMSGNTSHKYRESGPILVLPTPST